MSEHPEDKAIRIKAQAWAAKAATPWCLEHIRAIEGVIQRYADSDAHSLLDELREDFWSSSPEFLPGVFPLLPLEQRDDTRYRVVSLTDDQRRIVDERLKRMRRSRLGDRDGA